MPPASFFSAATSSMILTTFNGYLAMRKVFQSLLWVGAASFVTLSCSRIQEEPALVADPVEQGGTADFYMQVKKYD